MAASVGLLGCCPRFESEAQRSIEGFGFVPRVPLAGHLVDAQRDAFVVAGFELLEKVAGALSELGPLVGADAEPDAVLQGEVGFVKLFLAREEPPIVPTRGLG